MWSPAPWAVWGSPGNSGLCWLRRYGEFRWSFDRRGVPKAACHGRRRQPRSIAASDRWSFCRPDLCGGVFSWRGGQLADADLPSEAVWFPRGFPRRSPGARLLLRRWAVSCGLPAPGRMLLCPGVHGRKGLSAAPLPGWLPPCCSAGVGQVPRAPCLVLVDFRWSAGGWLNRDRNTN